MRDPRRIIGQALVTEKGTKLREGKNQYLFDVDPKANKIEIRQAVEQIFGVRVSQVRTMLFDGKPKRVGVHAGRRARWKKAIVTLEQGQAIEMFEQI
jgi:large subunit ribosomal protein L23